MKPNLKQLEIAKIILIQTDFIERKRSLMQIYEILASKLTQSTSTMKNKKAR